MSKRRDEAKARIQKIIDDDGPEVLREKHARGDFVGPADKEAGYRIKQFDKDSDTGRHRQTSRISKMGNWIAIAAILVILALAALKKYG